ncbi:DUF1573 domain-containing protein [Chitinophaga qingshengii]|uniref:DUF1573 domain-containing protein n=1 Tax=Chitinophaga qingshengii TaxID=1569794 RepID=A0ABR7TN64_9BACT|nr:DUF1573 domain-containing protein [Chitinophaga qingshengii]MBC9931921.1 DUF1573 domain-containing protein [Chitinophaga qingshengii]
MKTLLCLLTCGAFLMAACNNNKPAQDNAASAGQSAASGTTAESGKASDLNFEEKVHNFGDIAQGEKVEYSFKFTNTGSSPLVIEDAISSCGCTVPEWPKQPIKPGESGFMKVIFDSHGKSGYTEKEISIKTNRGGGYQVGPKIQCNIITK